MRTTRLNPNGPQPLTGRERHKTGECQNRILGPWIGAFCAGIDLHLELAMAAQSPFAEIYDDYGWTRRDCLIERVIRLRRSQDRVRGIRPVRRIAPWNSRDAAA
jgi:hypothetical protein